MAGAWDFPAYVNPVEQAPAFLCGVTAAIIAMRVKLPHIPGAAIFLLSIAIFAIPFSPIPQWYFRAHLQFSTLVAVVVALSAVYPPWIFTSRLMYKIGQVSYSMYLVHFAILAPSLSLAELLIPADNWKTMAVHFALTVAASLILSCFTYSVIEQPAIRWAAARTRRSAYGGRTSTV
jgi:peptidoglycan/LPS O-acetylase OafA/YrhL